MVQQGEEGLPRQKLWPSPVWPSVILKDSLEVEHNNFQTRVIFFLVFPIEWEPHWCHSYVLPQPVDDNWIRNTWRHFERSFTNHLFHFSDAANVDGRENVIVIHPDFRMVVLANRPGFPFLGNDFFGTLGKNNNYNDNNNSSTAMLYSHSFITSCGGGRAFDTPRGYFLQSLS